ncbi:MAG: hypothetical protein IKQ46_14600 [Bacteroidales bacterium]|jgi:hypothetical protein|nr:hypothetical protein [Bacteroidales bacterium]
MKKILFIMLFALVAIVSNAQKIYTDEGHGIKFSGPKGLEVKSTNDNSWIAESQDFAIFVQVYTVENQDAMKDLMVHIIKNTVNGTDFDSDKVESHDQATELLEGVYFDNVENQRLAMGMIFGFLTAKAAQTFPLNILYYNITYKNKIKNIVYQTVLPSIKSIQEN